MLIVNDHRGLPNFGGGNLAAGAETFVAPTPSDSDPLSDGASKTFVDSALAYAQRGWPVLPLAPRDKNPITNHGVGDATTNAVQIRAWWTATPNANVGIACGEPGPLVIDVDGDVGAASFARLENEIGPLPPTLTAETGKGVHLFFATPGMTIRNSAGKLGPGLDVRSVGGYVVAPPSVHPTDAAYRWVNPGTALAALPDTWVARLAAPANEHPIAPAKVATETSAYGAAALLEESKRVQDAPNGEQNHALNRAAFSIGQLVAGGEIIEAEARAALINAGLAMTTHDPARPWTPEDVTALVTRSMADGAREPRAAPKVELPALSARIGKAVDPKESDGAWIEIPVSRIFEPLPPIKWIVDRLITPGAPSIVAGFGYSGKTVAMQTVALSVAIGRSAWEAFATQKGRVLHVDFEQGPRLTSDRYQRLAVGMGIGPADIGDRLVAVCMPGVYLDTPSAEQILTHRFDGFDLVIVDSFHAACPTIEENDAGARRYLDMLTRISHTTGCAIVVIHHARKPSKESMGGAKMALRGSGALFDAADSILMFEADKDQPPRVTHTKARTSGRPVDPFVLKIEDVMVSASQGTGIFAGVSGQRGLTVKRVDIGAEVEAQRTVALETDCEAVLAALRSFDPPTVTSQDALRAKTGIGAERFRLAYATLRESKRVVHEGPERGGKGTRIFLPATLGVT